MEARDRGRGAGCIENEAPPPNPESVANIHASINRTAIVSQCYMK